MQLLVAQFCRSKLAMKLKLTPQFAMVPFRPFCYENCWFRWPFSARSLFFLRFWIFRFKILRFGWILSDFFYLRGFWGLCEFCLDLEFWGRAGLWAFSSVLSAFSCVLRQHFNFSLRVSREDSILASRLIARVYEEDEFMRDLNSFHLLVVSFHLYSR